MMQIQQLQNVLKLQAGESGLDNVVRWIYFADCLLCIQSEYKIENYIHGGEFVILTNRSVTDDNKKLMFLVEQMNNYNISALGINEGQISTELINYCNENKIPLFELPEKYPLIDLSQIMCHRLVLEENSKNSAEQLFSSILDAEHLSRESVMAQARYLNINLEGSFCVAEFAFKDMRGDFKGDSLALGQNIRRIIKSGFSLYIKEDLLILPQTGSILVLIPMMLLKDEQIREIVTGIINRAQTEYGTILNVGIGNSADYLEDVRKSRNEAAAAIKAASVMEMDSNLIFFSDLGIYTILSHVDDERVLDTYVEDNLGNLLQADSIGNSNLCETLENYLNHGCNAKKTAEFMFIHRNTLNYRLKKISEILNYDFDNLDNCLRLKLSFIILKYRNKKD